jgi:hypothetical protein
VIRTNVNPRPSAISRRRAEHVGEVGPVDGQLGNQTNPPANSVNPAISSFLVPARSTSGEAIPAAITIPTAKGEL